MKVANEQLERLVALLTIGLAVALERGKVTTAEANQILFSPHAMRLLRAAGVREVVVDLVHAGTEIEDIEFSLPERMPHNLHLLVADAFSCLETCDKYDFNADKWISRLLSGVPSKAETEGDG